MKKSIKLCIMIMLLIGILTFAACNGTVNFTLKFEADGEVYHTLITAGKEVIMLPQDPEKDGYIFDGWYWDKDEWKKSFTADSLTRIKLKSDMTVYARFIPDVEAESLTVAFESNGGSPVASITKEAGENVTAPVPPSREGFSFSGWFADENLSEPIAFPFVMPSQNITLYAAWTEEDSSFNLTEAVVQLSSNAYTYDGSAKEPNVVSVKVGGETVPASMYTIAYSDNVNAGTATVTLTGTGALCTGQTSVTFEIAKATLTVTPDTLSKYEGQPDPILTYTVMGAMASETPVFDGALTREEGEEPDSYEIYIGNLAPINAQGFMATNYSVQLISVQFEILESTDIFGAEIDWARGDYTYDGTPHEPVIYSVTLGDTVLDPDTDYVVSYSNNINNGYGIITVNGKGMYKGIASVDFLISKRSLIIIPDVFSKNEGEDDPDVFTFSYEDNVEGEIPAFTGTLARAVGETPGIYRIDEGTLALQDNGTFKAANYFIVVTEVYLVIQG